MAKYRHAKGPSALQVIIIILVVILSIAIIGGAAFAVYHFTSGKNEEPTEPAPTVTEPIATVDEPVTEPPTEDPDAAYTNQAKEYMSKMTLEDKIYQMLLVSPEALTGVDVATVAGDQTKTALQTHPVGGIIYKADNFEDEQQAKDLITNTKSFAKYPLFITVTEEGGDNSPIRAKLSPQGTESGSLYSKSGDQVVYTYAAALSIDLTKYGVNMNLAPCANLVEENGFGTTSKSTMELTTQAVKGITSKGIIPALKFFPTATDTDKTYEELTDNEFPPFAAGIDAGADVVIMGNGKVSTIDSDNPAFMSQRIVTELLISELGFDGVVMSADLSDSAVTDAYTTEQIITNAINAGVNVLQNPSDITGCVDAVKTALDNKSITQQQIDDSVTKILAIKFKYGIITADSTAPSKALSTDATTATQSTIQ